MRSAEILNGALLLYEKNKINNATGIKISFDCGSRCDGEIAGLSHFCEHMFFTGTKDLNKKEISEKYFDFIKVNAYTNYHEIGFTGQIITDELSDYLNFVAKMICESTFTKKAVENEKKVVIQEIVSYDDKYEDFAEQFFMSTLYDKKHYLNGVLGNVKSVKSISSKDVKDYVKKYFIANNCTITISSPLSFNKIKKLVESDLIAKLKPDPTFKKLPYDDDEAIKKNLVKFSTQNINKTYFYLALNLPIGYKDYQKASAMLVLSNAMEDFKFGVMKELRLERGLVYSSHISPYWTMKDSSLVFETECSKENLKPCVDVLINYLKKLKNEGVSDECLEKQKRSCKHYFDTLNKSLKETLNELSSYKKYHEFKTNFDRYKSVMRLTREDINSIISQLLSNPHFISVCYGDAKKDDLYTLKEMEEMLKSL